MRLLRHIAPACLAMLAFATPSPASAALPPIHHVFVIVLENEPESTTFSASPPAPYLATTLRSQGAFLPNYYGTGHESNDNYIAMISGQGPNPQNQGDCQIFNDFMPDVIGSDGQAVGQGCVFPTDVKTIADQLDAAGLTWRDYNQSMGADPAREPAECAHPGIGRQDGTQSATATDQYATRHNPFVYFHSIIDDTARCDSHVVNLDLLTQDLQGAASTPNYVFITPDLCSDGHDATCADKTRPGGFAGIDSFLREWIPRITDSPAYQQQNGLLAIIFDEADSSDSTSCCSEMPGPNSPSPGINGPGGGDTGAVLLSPCISPGTVSMTPYNHYTLLGSIENIFALPHLGYAQLPGSQFLGSDVFNRNCGASSGAPTAHLAAAALASSASTGPSVLLRWRATGPPAQSFSVQVRRTSGRPGGWRTLLTGSSRTSLRFRGRAGSTYQFRVLAITAPGIKSPFATATTVMPSGIRPAGGHYHGDWRAMRVAGAWEQRAIVGAAGSTFTLTYVGGSITLIGETGPSGGRARIVLDGRARTINLHAAGRHTRRAVFRVSLTHRRHRLTITILSSDMAIEGLAITNRTG